LPEARDKATLPAIHYSHTELTVRNSRLLGAFLVVAAAGCGGSKARESTPPDSVVGSSGPSANVKLTATPMLPGLMAHVDSVAAHPAMLRGSMSQHQAEVKHVVSAMHADMMALGMHSDAAYEALADSVVQGSAKLATAGGAGFNRQVMQHLDQIRRLASVYESKTAQMMHTSH
jgi:hypothetical protein